MYIKKIGIMLRTIAKTLVQAQPIQLLTKARFSVSGLKFSDGDGEGYESSSNAPNFEKSINNVTLLGKGPLKFK